MRATQSAALGGCCSRSRVLNSGGRVGGTIGGVTVGQRQVCRRQRRGISAGGSFMNAMVGGSEPAGLAKGLAAALPGSPRSLTP